MPTPSFYSSLPFAHALQWAAPVRPLLTALRAVEERRRPLQRRVHSPVFRSAQDDLLFRGAAGPHQVATIFHERGKGGTPTIVLGGFVPESTEQVFLLRRFLLRSGDVYCINYPRQGFSADLLCAQLADLVEELTADGRAPVVMGVSFGVGLVLEWLRRARLGGQTPSPAGIVLVSPVACLTDITPAGNGKPNTLLGRVLRAHLEPGRASLAAVEKSRTVLTRMFESGAQNKTVLRGLMSSDELQRLRDAVLGAIRGITPEGAEERVHALRTLPPPSSYFAPELLPLTTAPTLILFAENEEAVLDALSPTRFVLERAHRAYFPDSAASVVASRGGSPVQHASLIFHVFDFLPPLSGFYQRLKAGKLKQAA